ncbi:type IV conjugative transfer system protein TrbM [Campylobacter blaseri]|uniref:Conjugal transfer protein TrbM n=1 Tax=Campylobacter blaseri TaxID=2042961 RepID=A0A2P8QYE1_9BACT|nr:TrbM/KikA/MpfK family conjugal transfer protein [Campylobacter blaseri]PSM51264.1 conjugal transfer protein TrbM [Campylobacter blaseri]PSM52408.1 conjugal transfer protein TrbM [Campylobacter blaseri]QKF86579.1 type IV conjugative transfer system protein TrbM [Campylobacter blaseri]
MKKRVLVIISALFLASSLNAGDILTGDTKLACEAILCLSSGTRPSECSPSLKRYFSIHHRHWSDTVNARRNFLRLCPVGSSAVDDKVFADLRDNVLPNLSADKCTAEWLNNHPETKCVKENCGDKRCHCIEYKYRPRTKLFGFCNALYNHKYTNVKPKNVCKNTRWYSSIEWSSEKAYTNISKDEYNNLKAKGFKNLIVNTSSSKFCKRSNSEFCKTYYKVENIKKDCWVNKD